ncbi:DUF2169 domain-containing protein [Sorangium sp. So ce1389]|uniref:DUF2169 family type VI secretion system accessory protein n=1 Tax=Sorangium sp. So ce1389 TaxID=3133336 RepID=UPI003F5E0BA2
MKVVKPAKIPVLTRVVELGRRPIFHAAGIIAFPLGAPRALCDELTFWRTTAAALGERGVFDEGYARARGELLVAGSFFAPGGKPLPASYVRARVGPLDKRLAVIGDRFWRDDVPTPPRPIATLPIDWAHAFGGPGVDSNPHGKGAEPVTVNGHAVHPLPNVERYGAMMRAPSDRPEPAGFLPMDVTFAQRRRRAGTYDKRWHEEHFPGLPPDAEPTFFNAAPEDQWLDGFFRVDEEFLVEHMHPDSPRIEGRLPGLVTRCFVTHRTREGERFLEIPLRCDLVWLFPSEGIGAVVFHGAMQIAEDDAADIVHLVCACEEPAAPRPIEHYESALQRRLDKDRGAADLSDADLMPPRGSGVAPDLGESDMGRWVKSERLAEKNLRRGQERMLAAARARLEAQGLDPDKHGAAALAPAPEMPPTDDPEALAAYAQEQLPRLEDQVRELEAREAEGKEQARKLFADMGKDLDEAMAEASSASAGPPTFRATEHLARLSAMAADARAEGVVLEELEQRIADPRHRAELEQQEEGLREMYRRFAHHQPAAAAMDPEALARARIVVELARDTGEPLARRDFTGVNLAGMHLSGVDFSGAFLESADLSGCDLSGANLEGAVLARASLRAADLRGARLRGANLGGAVLHDAALDRADLSGAVLSGADLAGARFPSANLTGADLMEARLGGVDLSGAQLAQCTLIKADLRGTRFAGADLSDATFVECTLDGADFSRATLQKATFAGCTGTSVSFRSARFRQGIVVHGSSFPGADFRDADMERANLRGAALPGARFDGANLAGADLSECGAERASFEGAVLKGGLLIRTRLVEASLEGANLMDALASKARLAGARFTGANLFRADLSRVVGDARTTFADANVAHVRFLPKADVPPRGDA